MYWKGNWVAYYISREHGAPRSGFTLFFQWFYWYIHDISMIFGNINIAPRKRLNSYYMHNIIATPLVVWVCSYCMYYMLSIVHYLLSVIHYIVYCLLPIIHYRLYFLYCLFSVIYCILSIGYCILHIAYDPLSIIY